MAGLWKNDYYDELDRLAEQYREKEVRQFAYEVLEFLRQKELPSWVVSEICNEVKRLLGWEKVN